jgi:hypothetical protein
VILLVEGADPSVERDLEVKLPFYERSGTREVWLTDLSAEVTQIYSRPDSDGYRETLWVKRDETVASLTMIDLEVAADDILGWSRKCLPGRSRGLHGVIEQHRPGHRPDAARYRRDPGRHGLYFLEPDVPNESAPFPGMNTYVYDHRSLANVLGAHELALAGGDHE